jgi:2-desacetyl-2-hydroxyethyl bacteriochlorophyllide A dehydrogenase
MRVKRVSFVNKAEAALVGEELDAENLGPNDVLVSTEASLISPGTETATYLDLPLPDRIDPPAFPRRVGYANVGRVVSAGDDSGFKPGDRVFSMGNHVSAFRIDTSRELCIEVPEKLSSPHATFARMAVVSMTTLRTTTARLGDRAAVIGLGLVGNLAAQLCQIAGMKTSAIDLDPSRLEIAERSGIGSVHSSAREDFRSTFQLVIEATGSTSGGVTAANLVQPGGEVSIVGTPWGAGDPSFGAHALLGRVFVGYVTLRSGWEWQIPTLPQKHEASSLQLSARSILDWLAEGRIKVDPLLTHVVSPAECDKVYQGFANRNGGALGVVFDWTSLAN